MLMLFRGEGIIFIRSSTFSFYTVYKRKLMLAHMNNEGDLPTPLFEYLSVINSKPERNSKCSFFVNTYVYQGVDD